MKAVSEILIHKINKIISKNLRENFDTIKSNVVNVCSDLIEKNKISKNKIYQKFKGCMRNGMTLLVHGYSSTVFNTLKECKKQGINVHVLITDCSKENSGKLMKQALAAEGIKCELILDLSIGFYMNSIDCVVVGANAITENGGVINRMGTYSLAIIAKCFKKPFYVLSESLKYLKLYPIDQNDIPFNKVEKEYDMIDNSSKKDEFDSEYICDYTPPDYISLYFTDEGIFTASALSDEIIQTFYNQ